MKELSIVIPAKNERASLESLLPSLGNTYPEAEILVVDDGSSDGTDELCKQLGVGTVRHPYSRGNGAAIKSGARHARGKLLVFMDADGQHQPKDIARLLEKLDEGYDMVVGKRSASQHASIFRRVANAFYNWLASKIVGHPVEDLTSGMRAVDAAKFREFLPILPNGFSYPTTITMVFFRMGYQVGYEPIDVQRRIGKSHINLLKDGFRFLIIIFKVGSLYSPLKFFIPVSAVLFSTGLVYYGYTLTTMGRFTNMSALLFTTSILIFLIGLVSEQITTLMYQR